MNIIIKGLHLEITEAIESYVTKKLSRMDAFIDEQSRVQVELGKTSNHHKNGDIFRAEFNVHSHGQYSRAAAESGDLYAAIDEAEDQLFNTLSAKKDKKQTLWKKGAQVIKALAHGVAGAAGRRLKKLRKNRQ